MAFHRDNKPYSFKELKNILNRPFLDGTVQIIREYSQLTHKICITVRNTANDNVSKEFYSSIDIDSITDRFNKLIDKMTIVQFVELKEYLDTLSNYGFVKDSLYERFEDEEEYVPALIYSDDEDKCFLENIVDFINSYLECAKYYEYFEFEEVQPNNSVTFTI